MPSIRLPDGAVAVREYIVHPGAVMVVPLLDDGRLVVERPAAREAHDGCVMSFAYWGPPIPRATRLLNSQTGELLPVRVDAYGTERVSVVPSPWTRRPKTTFS